MYAIRSYYEVFHIPLKQKLLTCFHYEGTNFEFNFSKFWTFTQTKFSCMETDKDIIWQVRTANATGAMKVKVVCPKEEMLLMRYVAPDGEEKHVITSYSIHYTKLYDSPYSQPTCPATISSSNLRSPNLLLYSFMYAFPVPPFQSRGCFSSPSGAT